MKNRSTRHSFKPHFYSKFSWVVFQIVTLLCLPQLSYSETLEELKIACNADYLRVEDGICVCQATQRKFNPFNPAERLEKSICKYTTHVKQACADPEGFLAYVYPDRCYCQKTRTFLTEPLSTSDSLAQSRYVPVGGRIAYYRDGGMEETYSWDVFFMSLQQRVDQCIQSSQAIVAFEKRLETHAWDPGLEKIFNALPKHIQDRDAGAKTTKVSAIKKGKHGGQSLVVTKRSASPEWYDESDRPDIQGDPHFAVQAFHDILGKFFGYRVDSEHAVRLPDELEIQGALSKLNQHIRSAPDLNDLPDWKHAWGDVNGPVQTEFYSSAQGTVTPRIYLQKFAYQNQFPIAAFHAQADQTVFMHDTTYHVPGMVLAPSSLIEDARAQVRALLEFEAFFRERHPVEAKKAKFTSLLYKIILHRAISLDLGSATAFLVGRKDFNRLAVENIKEGILSLLGIHKTRFVTSDFSIRSTLEVLDEGADFLVEEADKHLFLTTLKHYLTSKAGDPHFTQKMRTAALITDGNFETLSEYFGRRMRFLEQAAEAISTPERDGA
jgi:hypothetical protein